MVTPKSTDTHSVLVLQTSMSDLVPHRLVRPKVHTHTFSTIAMMMYSNTLISASALIQRIQPHILDHVPRTKKKKDIDKKKIRAPYGAIVSARHWNIVKGLVIKENTKHWCIVTCQLMKPHRRTPGKMVKDKTLSEIYTPVEGQPDTYEISYFCSHCRQHYTIHDIKKAITFRNQLQLDVSMGDYLINVMMFPNSYKIVGCRSFEDGFKFIEIFLKHIDYDASLIWVDPKLNDVEPKLDPPPTMEFECRSTMFNTKFSMGVPIDREKLKRLLNRSEYTHIIKQVLDESTSNPQIKTYMFGRQVPMTYAQYLASPTTAPQYHYVSYGPDHEPRRGTRPYLRYLVNKEKPPVVTFVTFSSSETIISGATVDDLDYAIHQFYNIIEPHFADIREVIRVPKAPLMLDRVG